MARIKTVALWLISGLMALVMIGPGMQKFTSSNWERMFRVWGYPEHFYLVIGAVEVLAGIGLLIPKVAAPSAAVLVIVMIGAALTQILRGGRNGVGEFVLAGLLVMIAYARWHQTIGRRSGAAVERAVT